eukprot:5259845-Pyramimonas_sp.AAC.1
MAATTEGGGSDVSSNRTADLSLLSEGKRKDSSGFAALRVSGLSLPEMGWIPSPKYLPHERAGYTSSTRCLRRGSCACCACRSVGDRAQIVRADVLGQNWSAAVPCC